MPLVRGVPLYGALHVDASPSPITTTRPTLDNPVLGTTTRNANVLGNHVLGTPTQNWSHMWYHMWSETGCECVKTCSALEMCRSTMVATSQPTLLWTAKTQHNNSK